MVFFLNLSLTDYSRFTVFTECSYYIYFLFLCSLTIPNTDHIILYLQRSKQIEIGTLEINVNFPLIRNLEPNCQSSYSYSYSSVPRLSLAKIFFVQRFLKHLPVFLLGTENVVGGWMAILVVVCGKHLPVFLLGTENFMGGWMAILVVVCGKMCGKK